MPGSTRPDINRGDVITADFLNALKNDVVRELRGVTPIEVDTYGNRAVVSFNQPRLVPLTVPFIAQVTGFTSIGSNQWAYDVTEVHLAPTFGQFGVTAVAINNPPSPRSGTAINLAELGHSSESSIVYGVDTNGVDYPPDFNPIPIGGGGTDQTFQQTQYVHIVATLRRLETGNAGIAWVFDRQGTHDGVCPPEE
jgi:hypothetical protein